MHILIISDAYPPMRTSCATQIYDLAQAFIEHGHQVSIIIPGHSQKKSVEIFNTDGPTVYAVRCFKTKDVSYARRTIAEFINPFIIGFHLKRNSNFVCQKIDGIAWYSPSIFWGPLVKLLKRLFNCKAYLILRDIFPDWALDLGLLKKNLIYSFFKRVERYQYEQADYIGVQSPNNLTYFRRQQPQINARTEVLWNWIGSKQNSHCSIDLSETHLQGRTIFVYVGNMGVAQGMDALLKLTISFNQRNDAGFIFLGRGSEAERLKKIASENNLTNTLFYDEIDPTEVSGLLEQCQIGMIALDSRHTTHNIPGKLLSYLQAGLTILAKVNNGSDMVDMIRSNKIGYISTSDDESELHKLAVQCIKMEAERVQIQKNSSALIKHLFTAERASACISSSLDRVTMLG